MGRNKGKHKQAITNFVLRVYSLTTSKSVTVVKGSTCADLCVLMAEPDQNPDLLSVVIFGISEEPSYRAPNDFVLPILNAWIQEQPLAINHLQFVVLSSEFVPAKYQEKPKELPSVASQQIVSLPPEITVRSELTMILIGSTGAGKSSFGNYLASSKADQQGPFNVYSGPNPGTKSPELKQIHVPLDLVGKHYLTLQLIDTPGLNEDETYTPGTSEDEILRQSKDLKNMRDLCENIQKVGRASGIFLCLQFSGRLDKQVINTIKYYRRLLAPLFDSGRVAVIQTQVPKIDFEMWMEETDENGKEVWESRCQEKVTVVVDKMKKEGIEIPGDMCFQVDSCPKKPIYPNSVSAANKKSLVYYSYEERVNIANAIQAWTPIDCSNLTIPLPHNLEIARTEAIARVVNAMSANQQLKDIQALIREQELALSLKKDALEAVSPKQTWISKKGNSYINLSDTLVRIVVGEYTLTELTVFNARFKETDQGDDITHIIASPNYMTLHSEEYGCCWMVRGCLTEFPIPYSKESFDSLTQEVKDMQQTILKLQVYAKQLAGDTESERLQQMLEILNTPATALTVDRLLDTIADIHKNIQHKVLDDSVFTEKISKQDRTEIFAAANKASQPLELTVVMIGATGAGKSSFGNFLASSDSLQAPFSVYTDYNQGTRLSEIKEVNLALDLAGNNSLPLKLIDTPGFERDEIHELTENAMRQNTDLLKVLDLVTKVQTLGKASGVFLCIKFDMLDQQAKNTLWCYRQLLAPLFDRGRVAVILTQVYKDTFEMWTEETDENGKPVWEMRCQAIVDKFVSQLKEAGVDLPGDIQLYVDSNPKRPIYRSNITTCNKTSLAYFSHQEKINLANLIQTWTPIDCSSLTVPLPLSLDIARKRAIDKVENAMGANQEIKFLLLHIRSKLLILDQKQANLEEMQPKQTWISKNGTSFLTTDKPVRIVTGEYTITEETTFNAKFKKVDKGNGATHIIASPMQDGSCWAVRGLLTEMPPNYSKSAVAQMLSDIDLMKQSILERRTYLQHLTKNNEFTRLHQMLEILQAPANLSTIDSLIHTIADVHANVEF